MNSHVSASFSGQGERIPGICTFSEFIKSKYGSGYSSYLRQCFAERTLPFPGSSDVYFRGKHVCQTEILRVYANRIDYRSFRINTIVRVSLSDEKNIYQFRYRVEGTFRAPGGFSLFEGAALYRHSDICRENRLSDYLVPLLTRNDLDTEAGNIIRNFCPDAAADGVMPDARILAGNIGFRVKKARLSDDDSVLSGIFFSDSYVSVYEKSMRSLRKVPAGTILIDTEAQKNRCCSADEIIVHECVHACEHFFFWWLQNSYSQSVSGKQVQLNELTSELPEDSPLQWVENQARHITPRIRHTPLYYA